MHDQNFSAGSLRQAWRIIDGDADMPTAPVIFVDSTQAFDIRVAWSDNVC
jgi:hypothetical protein